MKIIKNTPQVSYTCNLCGRRYNRRYDLLQHDRAVHQNIKPKPLECPCCPKRFTRKYNMLRHSYAKPFTDEFKCTYRFLAFTRQVTLTRHLKMAHNVNYGNKYALSLHLSIDKNNFILPNTVLIFFVVLFRQLNTFRIAKHY